MSSEKIKYLGTILRKSTKLHKKEEKFKIVYIDNNNLFQTIMLNGFMRWLLRFLVSLIAIGVRPLTYLLTIRRTRKCPPPTNPILFKSATTLTGMIRNKQVINSSYSYFNVTAVFKSIFYSISLDITMKEKYRNYDKNKSHFTTDKDDEVASSQFIIFMFCSLDAYCIQS